MSIDKLPSGKYRVRVDIGFNADGKRKRKTGTFTTKREAQAAERTWLEEQPRTRYIEADITLVDYINDYYLPAAEQRVRYNSLRGYKRDINNYILPALAYKKMTEITPDMVQAMLNTCKTHATAKNARDTIRQIFNDAISRGMIKDNPAKGTFAFPKREVYPEDHNGTWLTSFDQHNKYLAQLDKEFYKLLATLGLSLGLRKGEIFGLDWENIDFEKRLVHITQTYVLEDGGYTIMPPKTKKSDRYIPIRKSIADYLYDIYTNRGKPTGAIVINRKGNRADPHISTRLWARYIKSRGLEYVSLLNMRHSFATACINSGINITVVSRMLGHTTIETTMNRYVRFKSSELVDILDDVVD